MAIIITGSNTKSVRVNKAHFPLELDMQQYIHDNPEVIPIYELSEDRRLFIAAREFPTASGAIDALGFDEVGNIYIVETKLFRNPDKRRVVAQALDYGASLWRHSMNADSFLALISRYTEQHFGKPFAEAYANFFSVGDALEQVNSIAANLRAGNIKFVVLMDTLHDSLKDLIVYINQNSQFDIYAVELEQYKYDSFEITIPRLFGAEVKKSVSSTASDASRRQWDATSFWADAESRLDEQACVALRSIYEWSRDNADSIKWGTGVQRGSFSPRFREVPPYSMFTVYSDGSLQLNYQWYENTTTREVLLNILRQHVSIDGITDVDVSTLDKPHTISSEEVTAHSDEILAALAQTIKELSDEHNQ